MLFSTIIKTDEQAYPDLSFASEAVRIKLPGSIYTPEEKAISEVSNGAPTIFLKHYCMQGDPQGYPSGSKLILRNDCSSVIRSLTVTSRKDGKEVFFIDELASEKTISLIFKKNDVYDIFFSSASKKIHGSIKIVSHTHTTTGFKFNQRSTWLK